MKEGKLIISLDFELHWGAVEKWDLQTKKTYFDNTRLGIPKTLNLFKEYDVAATWATVGFLFAKNKEQLQEFSPLNKPSYVNTSLNYYSILETPQVGQNESEDPYHFATSLIQQIIETPKQELATHTFSHYYCQEKGQSVEEFRADLQAAQAIAQENFGITLKSLVFPRNQYNKVYLDIVKEAGIEVVRTNPDVWFWKQNHKLVPVMRAFDTLRSISKTLSFQLTAANQYNGVLLLPASRFLRPFSKKEKTLQSLKRNRVLNEMTEAAKKGLYYHLWWHPHNFGNDLEENLLYLEEILQHYNYLNKTYGFLSASMISAK